MGVLADPGRDGVGVALADDLADRLGRVGPHPPARVLEERPEVPDGRLAAGGAEDPDGVNDQVHVGLAGDELGDLRHHALRGLLGVNELFQPAFFGRHYLANCRVQVILVQQSLHPAQDILC